MNTEILIEMHWNNVSVLPCMRMAIASRVIAHIERYALQSFHNIPYST